MTNAAVVPELRDPDPARVSEFRRRLRLKGAGEARDVRPYRAPRKHRALGVRSGGACAVVCLCITRPVTPLRDAATLMRMERVDCLPVVESDNRLVGTITSTDFLRLVEQLTPNPDAG